MSNPFITYTAQVEKLKNEKKLIIIDADFAVESLQNIFKRCGTPTHLFKKSEIETAMRNADDRRNNRLVIDENGYVKIISQIKEFYK